jgi:hypothetical protein
MPKALSVDVAVTPLAKLYNEPEEEPLRAPVPEVPKASVVLVAPVLQFIVVLFPLTRNPEGIGAAAVLPIELKFSVTGVPMVVRESWLQPLTIHSTELNVKKRRFSVKLGIINIVLLGVMSNAVFS